MHVQRVEMKIVAVTQARFSSSRLPGKVLKKLGSETVLDLHLKRIQKSKLISSVIVATTMEPESAQISLIALKHKASCYHGSLDDVLDRFYKAVIDIQPDYIIRLTSDCPLIDAALIDDLINKFLEKKCDYASNCINPTLPDGMDAEIFTFAALEKAWNEANKNSEREHVTPYIRESGKFSIYSVEYEANLSDLRMTLDTQEDFQVLTALVDACGENSSLETLVNYLHNHPELRKINSINERNAGYQKSLMEDLKK